MSEKPELVLFPDAEPAPPSIMHAACFSGHRLEKLPMGVARRAVVSMLQEEIHRAVSMGITTFYCGTADGIDLFAADIVRRMRAANPELRIICVKPFRDFGKKLNGSDRYLFNMVMMESAAVIELSDHYYPDCFRVRNQYLVSHSDLLIAVMGESRSGTGQTIRFAQRRKIPVHLIDVTAIEQHLSDRPQLVQLTF